MSSVAAGRGEATDTGRRGRARTATVIDPAIVAATKITDVHAPLRETMCVRTRAHLWSRLLRLKLAQLFARGSAFVGAQDRRDRVRSRSRSHSRNRGRHRSRGRDRDRGRDRGRDRRSQERRADRPSRNDDGPSPRSMTEVPIIAYADGGYEVKVSVPPDITVAALAAALYNAGMTPPPPVEYGSGAGALSNACQPLQFSLRHKCATCLFELISTQPQGMTMDE